MNKWIVRWGPRSIVSLIMVIASPLFALPFFALVELVAEQAPAIDAAAQHGRPLQVIGYALFVSMLAVDPMLRAFYLTVPILAVAAFSLLRIRLSGPGRFAVCALGVGLAYTALFYAGLYFDFLEEPFFT